MKLINLLASEALVWASSDATVAADAACACGPTCCVETPKYREVLATKKKTATANYPARLVARQDKLDPPFKRTINITN